jgi:hypothetical protein
MSSVTICPPVSLPAMFPENVNCVESSTVADITPAESSGNEVNEVETKAVGEGAMNNCDSEDFCSNGHELRWHAWRCKGCDKRGYGLRFGCAECRESNLCIDCQKSPQAQVETVPMSLPNMHDEAKVRCEEQPSKDKILDKSDISTLEADSRNGNSNRRNRSVNSASKSVLSLQPQGSSSAAQLLGGLVQQHGSRARSSSRPQTGDSKSLVGAGGSGQRRSGAGQRASASVLTVKQTSTSAAAGILGPLMEQKGKC